MAHKGKKRRRKSLVPTVPHPRKTSLVLGGLCPPLQGRVAPYNQSRATWAGVWEPLQRLLGLLGPKSF